MAEQPSANLFHIKSAMKLQYLLSTVVLKTKLTLTNQIFLHIFTAPTPSHFHSVPKKKDSSPAVAWTSSPARPRGRTLARSRRISSIMSSRLWPVLGINFGEHISIHFGQEQSGIQVLNNLNLRGGTRKVGKQERNRRKNEGERAGKKT